MEIRVADLALVDNGKLLLVQQRKAIAYGLWSLPGGQLEEGETPEQALHREIQEELGVKLTDVKPFKTYRFQIDGHQIELNTFTGKLEGKIILNDEELMAYGWFSPDSLITKQLKLRAPAIRTQQARDALQGT